MYTTYNLAVFEEEKHHNETRFTGAIITYVLSQMFRSEDSPKLSYEDHAKDLGVIMPKRKAMVNKESEVDKANKTMEAFLTNTDWEE